MKRYKRSHRFAQTDILEKNLLDLKAVLDLHSVPFFLAQGTLLAAAREGHFFPHSVDCDLHVSWEHRFRLADAIAGLVAQGFRVTKLIEKEDLRKMSITRDEETTDIIFLISRGRGRRRCWIMRGARYPARFFDEGEPIQFLNESFLAPMNYSEYLRRRYGHYWREPVIKHMTAKRLGLVRDKLELGPVLLQLQYPLWPLREFKHSTVSIVKLQGGARKGMVVLLVSGDRLCLRYVREVRSDGSIRVYGTTDRTASAWRPAEDVLARVTRLRSEHGSVVIPLDGLVAQQAFRYSSALAAFSIGCMRALRPSN